MNPVYSCSLEIEDTSHYLLHCHHFALHCIDLMNNVKSICDNFESMIGNNKITLLLYGDSRFDENKNKFLLQSFIKHIKKLNDSPDPFQINFIYFPTLYLIFSLIYLDSFSFYFFIFTNLIFYLFIYLFIYC